MSTWLLFYCGSCLTASLKHVAHPAHWLARGHACDMNKLGSNVNLVIQFISPVQLLDTTGPTEFVIHLLYSS